jgi:nucleotide-binding universal stress UspA family protein
LGALKRENVLKYYLGSIARKLTRKAPCSVLLMLNPSVERHPCKHIVVNGFDSPQTLDTLKAAFYVGDALTSQKITLVEEISEARVAVSVSDDRTLRKATLKKEKINREEKIRVKDLVKKIPLAKKENLKWETQSIFGRRGYSIGHYARVVRADLLVMNTQEESSFLNRFFPKDLEHILAELPTDVLIIKSKQHG